jgi:hypothetical protein
MLFHLSYKKKKMNLFWYGPPVPSSLLVQAGPAQLRACLRVRPRLRPTASGGHHAPTTVVAGAPAGPATAPSPYRPLT